MRPDQVELRRQAEERLQRRTSDATAVLSADEMQRLLHELQVHQIELEMQNEALRESRAQLESATARYADLYDFAPVGYVTLDPQGVITNMNLNGARLLGSERARLQRRRFGSFVVESNRSVFNACLAQVFTTGAKHTCEVELVSKDQPAQTVQIEASLSSNGQECHAVIVDITERKRAEDALRRSEQRMVLAQDAAQAGTWEWDLETNRNYWSDSLWALYGLAPGQSEPSYQAWEAAIHPDDRERVKMAVNVAASAGQEFDIQWRVKRPAGESERWLMARGRPIMGAHGRPERYIGIVIDITERKRAQAELGESAERLRLFIEHAPAALAMFDREMRYLVVSRRWLDDYRLGDGTIIGRTHYEVFPEIPARWRDAHRRGLAGEVIRAAEDPFERGDGTVQWVRWEVRPWYLADGAVGGIVIFSEDISERKQAELELRRFQQIVETSSEMLIFLDRDLCYRVVNPAYAAMRHATPTDLQGRLAHEVVGAEDYAVIGPHLESALTGQAQRFSHRITDAGGKHRHLESDVRPFRGHDGAVLGVVVSIHDVTEAREAQAALEAQQARLADLVAARTAELQASETKLRTIYDLLPVGISITDRSGRIIDCNRASEDLLGISREEHFQRTYDGDAWKVIRPDWTAMPPAEYASVRAATEGQTVRDVEMGIVRPDGVAWISVSATPYPPPDAGVVIAYVDITARKQAETKLQASEARARAIVDASSVPLVLGDGTPQILYLNPAFVDTFGYTLDDIPTWSHWRLAAYPDPDYRQWVATTLQDAAGQVRPAGESSEPLEVAIRCQDGRVRNTIVRITSLGEAHGGLQITTLYDVTDLLQAKALAEQATRLKSEFLANMSHEIRTPMNAVLGFCYLLERRPLDTTTRNLVSKVGTAGRSLLTLINDILDFSKIEAGRLELESVPFSLRTVLDDLAAIMATSAGGKQLELIITPPPDSDIDALIGDQRRLHQVLVNLLSNAIKFTERGEVELRIDVVSADQRQVNLRFAVRDTGIGISTAQQSEIFTAFMQADPSISRRFGGTGLGLAISRRLVGLMGGELRVESAIGHGSEFWFVLPFQYDRQVDAPRPELARLHLLVADDSATAGAALVNTAASLGWSTDLVDSGQAALAQTLANVEGQRRYDVVLLDWMMPEPDGLTTAQRIQDALRDRIGRFTPPPIVIMVTAYARDELLAQPGIAAVDSVLNKPVTPSALYDTIAGVLNRRAPGSIQRLIKTPPAPMEVPMRRIPGVRVLIVDDSDINREVAQGILEADGAIVHQASDGQEALDWLQAHPDAVDLVLMDVQMPRLDGYAATRRIRADPRWQDLPILALTAGALQALRDAAFASGMNDFIAKPFAVDQMMAQIQRWTGCRPEPVATGVAMATEHGGPPHRSHPTAPDEAAAPALPGIDLTVGLKQWQAMGTYRTYLTKFVADYANAGLDIATAARNGDRAAVAALAHKLIGVAGNLAFPRVAELARQLEARLREGEPIIEMATTLQAAIDEVCTGITEWLRTEDPVTVPRSATADAHREGLDTLFGQLLQALDHNDPDRAETVLTELQGLVAAMPLTEIQSHVTDFDFRGAEASTLTLMRDLSILVKE